MCRIFLFVEDSAFQEVLSALLDRLTREFGVEVEVRPYSASKGHSRVLKELRIFCRDLRSARESLPDLLIVGIDANCLGYNDRRKEILDVVSELPVSTELAIPDPHIERWLLLDSAAFKSVLGRGCDAPDQKCDRDRYKELLAQAVRDAGLTPLIGGLEHARDIVAALDLNRLKHSDKSFGRFLDDLQSMFRRWSS